MLKNVLCVSATPGEKRAIVLRESRPTELIIQRFGTGPHRGEIYLAQIEQWSPALNGAFVSLGGGMRAFMPASHKLGVTLKPGDKKLVSVMRGSQGEKLARVTLDIAIPGPRLVLLPTQKNVLMSGKTKSKLAHGLQLMTHHLQQAELDSLIIRENALNFPPTAVVEEGRGLHAFWAAIVEESRQMTEAGKISIGFGSLMWPMADALARGYILVGQKNYCETLKKQWAILSPDLVDRFVYRDSHSVENQIDQAIETALCREIPFGSQGNLIFDEGAAVTSIDINAFSNARQGARHILNANLAAVPEIARLVRLKGIGGTIVIDVIKMVEEPSNTTVETELRKAFADDPAEVEILPVSKFGLIQMTRERLGSSISDLYYDVVAPRQMSFESITVQLYRTLLEDAEESSQSHFTVHAHPAYVSWLNAREHWRSLMPSHLVSRVHWKVDASRSEREPTIVSGSGNSNSAGSAVASGQGNSVTRAKVDA
jgi:Rne/Rng family ribonuclease